MGALPRRGRLALLHALIAAGGAAVVVKLGPPGTDLAAHVYQRGVWLHSGFALWDNFWYAGRYTFVTYSLGFYPLAATVGITVVAIASAAAASAAFAVLVDREWPSVGPWPAIAFTLVWPVSIFSGALPYELGVALGLWALVALQACRRWVFGVLVAATFAASPLAFALFGVVVVVGVGLARRRLNRFALGVVAGTALVGGLLWRMFPDSGRFPFPPAELCAVLVFCGLGFAFTWRVQRAGILRAVFGVYALACVVAYVVPSGVGENVVRLRMMAIPVAVLALSLRGWRPIVPALAVAVLATSWNLTPIAFSFARTASDPSTLPGYWQPTVAYLKGHLPSNYRVEVVETASHWEANYLSRAGIPIARGWYRQDDFPANRLLYGPLTAKSYVRWLHRLGVAYVVLPDVPLDYSSRREARVVRGGRTGLVLVRRGLHVVIYSVPDPRGIVTGAGGVRLLALERDSMTLGLPAPGRYSVAVRYSPYWKGDGACVAPSPSGMIVLHARRAGRIRLRFDPTVSRALSTLVGADRSCT